MNLKPGESYTKPLPFTKMTGTGNDFIFIDVRDGDIPLDRRELARNLCRRSLNVGADGLVFVEKPTEERADFKWDFYNADGSSAEFCGNAARCVARFAREKHIAKNDVVRFQTAAGLVEATVLTDGLVKVRMPSPKIIEKQVEIPIGEHLKTTVLYLDTGVPHVVKETDDWEEEYLADMGGFLRHHEKFSKTRGANVTFFEVRNGSRVQSATFERGVEAVTLACGTGAVAAAVATVLKRVPSPITVDVPGGVLVVEVSESLDQAFLIGDARFICAGEIFPESVAVSES